jgi:hypothetical protein
MAIRLGPIKGQVAAAYRCSPSLIHKLIPRI